jgi:polysaccharide chain length determinant protein (PEP-CTERM system associated)
MDEQGIKLGDLAGMLRRRGRVAAWTAGLFFLASLLLAALLPGQYQSYTTMLVEPQTISKRLVEPGVEEGELINRLHIMTMQILSRARLARVIEDLKLYPELADQMTREEVIGYMRDHIWVEPVLPELETDPNRRQEFEVNTFRLNFRHEDANVAAAVANRLANDFIDEHIRDRVQVSGDTAEFIEAELTRLSTQLREIEAQIAQVKAENIGSLPEDRTANELQLQRALDGLRESQRRLSEAESDEGFYRQQAAVARMAEGTNRGDVMGRAVTPGLRLQELEILLGELRARGLTERHPDVVAARAEIDQLRQRLADDEGAAAGSPATAAEQEAKGQAERAALKAQSERAEIARLQSAVETIQNRLAATPRVAEQIDALTRQYASLSDSFASYSNKRLEASVAANMERRQKGEQFRVLETAFPAQSPVSPNRPLIVIVGALLGLVLGFGVAVAMEAADSTFHAPRALQESLRVPVLASIPGILLDADRAALRRRRRREVLTAAAITALCLVTAGLGYVYVNMPHLYGGGASVPAATQPAPAPAGGAGGAGAGAAAPTGG